MIGLPILLRVFKAVPTANISFYLNNTKMHNINHSERLPYEKLAALGIDREKADSLPQEVKEKLASGEVTPLMQVSISARNGDIITLPLKLQLTTDQQGNPALMAYPVRAVLEKERNQVLRLSDQEAERLKSSRKPWKSTVKRPSSICNSTPKPNQSSIAVSRMFSWNRSSRTWRRSTTSNWACSKSSRYARENPLS